MILNSLHDLDNFIKVYFLDSFCNILAIVPLSHCFRSRLELIDKTINEMFVF